MHVQENSLHVRVTNENGGDEEHPRARTSMKLSLDNEQKDQFRS